MFDQGFGLRVGQILTRNHHMLIQRHAYSSSFIGAFQRTGQ
jgi:hypothetical protein